MDYLDIAGDYGKYQIILKDIELKGNAYIMISNATNINLLIEEAKSILKNYNPKHIYASNGFLELPYNLAFTIDNYHLDYLRFPQNKDFKMKPLALDNRQLYSKIWNKATQNLKLESYLSESDVLDKIRGNANCGYIYNEKTFIGVYEIDGSRIVRLAVDQLFQLRGLGTKAIKRVINKMDESIDILLSSDNEKGIKLALSVGFIFERIVERWYEVIN